MLDFDDLRIDTKFCYRYALKSSATSFPHEFASFYLVCFSRVFVYFTSLSFYVILLLLDALLQCHIDNLASSEYITVLSLYITISSV